MSLTSKAANIDVTTFEGASKRLGVDKSKGLKLEEEKSAPSKPSSRFTTTEVLPIKSALKQPNSPNTNTNNNNNSTLLPGTAAASFAKKGNATNGGGNAFSIRSGGGGGIGSDLDNIYDDINNEDDQDEEEEEDLDIRNSDLIVRIYIL